MLQISCHGLWRFTAEHQHSFPRFPWGTGKVPGQVQIHPCWWVPGHQLQPVPDCKKTGCQPQERMRCWRRCAEYLLVSRSQNWKYPELQERLPRLQAIQAGAELPLNPNHCERCKQRNCQKQQAAAKGSLLSKLGWRKNKNNSSIQRPRRRIPYRLGNSRCITKRPHWLQGVCHSLPYKRPIANFRGSAPKAQHSA